MVIRHFREAFSRENPRHLLKIYRDVVRDLHKKKKALGKGKNSRRWKPLSPATLESYRQQVEARGRELRAIKTAIKALVYQGFLGNKKPRRNLVSLEIARVRKQNREREKRSTGSLWT
jgi:hypothetical protein